MSVSTFWASRATPSLGLVHALASLEAEGLGDNANRKSANLLHGNLCHDGSGTRARSATLARSDEDHVCTSKRVADIGTGLLSRLRANLGVGTGHRGHA